ncbi:hypothetical protein BS78_03G166900 [Paspalum vaginatum]|nr:hypothetical protein BS78_03G166900 [Paspalum vaginatum]
MPLPQPCLGHWVPRSRHWMPRHRQWTPHHASWRQHPRHWVPVHDPHVRSVFERLGPRAPHLQPQALCTPTPAPSSNAFAPPPQSRDGISLTPDAPPTGVPLERPGTVDVAGPSTAAPLSPIAAEPRRGSPPARGPYWCPEHGWTAECHVLLPDAGDDGEDHVFTPRPGGSMAVQTGAPRLYDHPPIPAEGRPIDDGAVVAPGLGVLVNPGGTRAARRSLPPYYVDAKEVGLATLTPASPEPVLPSSPPPRRILRRTATVAANRRPGLQLGSCNPAALGLPSAEVLNMAGSGGGAFSSFDEGELSRI